MLSNPSNRRILLGGYVAVILLTVILGIGALRISDTLSDLNRRLVAHPFTVSNTVRDIKTTIVDIHRDMKDIALVLTPNEVGIAAKNVAAKEAQALEAFKVVEERFLGNKAQVEEARRTFVEWRDIRSEVIDLVMHGKRLEAISITVGKGSAQVETMIGQLNGLIDFANNKAAEFLAESNSQYESNKLFLMALIFIVVLSGGIIATMVIVTVTRSERLLAERDRQIRQAHKMEAVGQLTGGLAHDLNNVLAIISGNVELLKLRSASDTELAKLADAALKGVNRAGDLTRKLLNYSRTDAGQTRRVTANEFIGGMENLIAKSLTPAIKLDLVLSDAPWMIEIDPSDLETALLNLAVNSRDAMPDGGSLVIQTANKVIDQTYVNSTPGSTAGEFVMIAVSDTGTGMTPEQAEKAFEPFFTTKEVGKGTGLGLSMVYSFVQRSGGHVKIYTEPGEGTEIRLYLPRSHGEADGLAASDSDQVFLADGKETVLIVDDEAQLVEAAASILGSLGYRTITATGPEEALSILRSGHPIDLLFSDVIMPGPMNGYQLAVTALEERPGLKVLLTSGFTRHHEEAVQDQMDVALELTRTLLHKPYNIRELAIAVRQALDRTDPG